MKREVRDPVQGLLGYMHEVEIEKDSVLVFQLPRETRMISETYIQGVLGKVKEFLPEGRTPLVIGADVNIYEIAGEDATALKLKGLLPC